MSDVGRVTIDTVARSAHVGRRVSATVNVGGVLVAVECDIEHDRELSSLVAQLDARLSDIALETVQQSLNEENA